ncbi:MAG: fumarate hydratase C-terminal domain-containing protein [Candidatus Desulfobacillus denitrificans]
MGGAACLASKANRGPKLFGSANLGIDATHAFDLNAMPVTVAAAVDASGSSVHSTQSAE